MDCAILDLRFEILDFIPGAVAIAGDEYATLFSRVHGLYRGAVTKLLSVRIKNHIQINPVAFVYSKKLIENSTKYQIREIFTI